MRSPGKRYASRSPSGSRDAKRHAPSSPEEGELDDIAPPALPASLPPRPEPTQPDRLKIPFPFKKKEQPRDERRPREPHRIADHWEPSYTHSRHRGYSPRSPSPKHRLPAYRSPVYTNFSPPHKDYHLDRRRDWERDRGRRDIEYNPWKGASPPAPSADSRTNHRASSPPPPKPSAIPRIRHARRSRKEEEKAYGRTFEGCGEQSDYNVTTKLGEGTFGEVHKALHKRTNTAVALKRILMHNEKEGMPVTALREIKILKALNHPCIINLLDMFVVRSNGKEPLSVYMVFPYMDHDLAGLLENERVKLQPSHIKLYMKQLLEGTEYMHSNHILHRDMKAANLLISNTGSLRIADFGLARAFTTSATFRGKEKKYTNCVVTRWYRPPELLLGAQQYGGEVDIWGIGCVLAEMFTRKPILPGTSDVDQLEKIWQLCGTPNQHTWPNHDALPGCEGVKRFNTTYSRRLKQTYDIVVASPETVDLLDQLLVCNPKERLTASQALDHRYFWSDPLPADPKSLPSYEASHEFDRRAHHRQPHHGPPPGGRPPPSHPQDHPPPRGPPRNPMPPRQDHHRRNNNSHRPPPPPHVVNNPPIRLAPGAPPPPLALGLPPRPPQHPNGPPRHMPAGMMHNHSGGRRQGPPPNGPNTHRPPPNGLPARPNGPLGGGVSLGVPGRDRPPGGPPNGTRSSPLNYG
ncbi:Pkinase-domain-containing protein [Pleurotus eryngii]|uniref:Pkinase-domain-containing protein n=1 Tax=Pleurotus eryngii TaxID=5323 RepID=A0A9P6DEZ8_PLEER|nr:Pkinase-domain-containing protein [Pleurotus eryngii]